MIRDVAPKLEVLNKVDVINPEQLKLSSGADAFFIGGCLEDIAQIDLVFDAGAKYQNVPLQAGITAAMLLEGSGGRKGVDVMDELDGYGAYIDVSSDYDRFTLSVFSTIRSIDKVLKLVKSILEQPNFEQENFDLLISNKRQNFLVQSEKVSVLARRRFYRELFNDHEYGNLASLESYDTLTLQDCKDFYSQVLRSSKLDCFVAGNMTSAHVKLIENCLSEIEMGGGAVKTSVGTINNHASIQSHIEKSGVQTGLRIGKKCIRRGHEDFSALQVTVTALGGYFGSRLMKNIREDKGFTYGIGAGLVTLDHAGIFFISTEVGNQYLEQTLVEINKEIDLLKQNIIPEDELFLVKNYISGSVARSLDGAFEQMEKFKTVHYSGLNMDYYNSYLADMREVSAERVMSMAQTYLSQDTFIQITAGEATKSS